MDPAAISNFTSTCPSLKSCNQAKVNVKFTNKPGAAKILERAAGRSSQEQRHCRLPGSDQDEENTLKNIDIKVFKSLVVILRP